MKKSKRIEESYMFLTSKGFKTVYLGKTYIGLGYSGMSDGVEITGTLTEFERSLDSATLLDNKGMIHAVIPSTLEEI